jgi:hypothetical protein
MKLRGIHIILIVILVVAILMITSSDSVVPYSKDMLFSNMYKYEGMVNLPPPLTTEQFDALKNEVKNSVSQIGSSSSPTSVSKSGANGVSKSHSSKKDSKKVEGFALQPAPFGASEVLDRYGSTPSGPQCFGKSSGYSNSLGPLCLSQEDAKLLSTRGGNISGTDSTIGR